jgi:Uma2 family endonuclease
MLGARLRLTSMRYVIPDLAVGKFVREGSKNAPTDVTLVVEITSPGNAATDRNRKKRYYAEAGIKWYLLVEPNFADYRSTTLILFRLEGGKYVEHAVAKPGETLVTNVSFPIEISTDDLVGF